MLLKHVSEQFANLGCAHFSYSTLLVRKRLEYDD